MQFPRIARFRTVESLRVHCAAIGAPIPEVSFMPTGGIGLDNAGDYLALPNVACIGGSWIAPPALLRDKNFTAIGELAAAAASLTATFGSGNR